MSVLKSSIAFVVWAVFASPALAGPAPGHPALDLLPVEARAAVTGQLAKAGDNAPSLIDAIVRAPEAQRKAVGYLLAHMPEADLKGLSADFLLNNVRLSYLAREATPWAAKIPEELFFDAVLPSVSVNERRDDWRQDFFDRFLPVVRDCPTAAEAVKRLNVEVFKTLNVAYHATKRPKPDQSPYESTKAGYASCTGLSVLLVDACRAVGIPARVVGTPRWTDDSGNHTWVETWDREWSFVGACEPSKLNEGWFVEKASKADESTPRNRIYATSFRKGETHFPMVWNRASQDVPAEDVTRRYTLRRKVTFQSPSGPGEITIRQGGRLIAQDAIDGPAHFELPGDTTYEVIIKKAIGGEVARTVKLTAEAEQVVEIR